MDMSKNDTCFDLGEVGQFQPHAKYHHGLDMVIYLAEDCTYTSEPVDGFLTIFWHPSRERAIGVKLKGFRHTFLKLKAKNGWSEDSFLPLIEFIEAALASGVGDEIMREEERRRKYEVARRLTAQIGLPPDQVREIVRAA